MKRSSKIFLKVAVFIGGPLLTLFIFLLPMVITGLSRVISVSAYLQYLGFIGLYGAVIPFLFELYQTIKFVGYTNRNEALSESSAKALKNIRYCGITISVLYVIAMPLLFLMADGDDAPGIILFALLVILSTSMSAVFANVFEKICHSNRIS
ncbi:DUF2975 domain-containing protein [Clostridium chromiireducens]|uniref:DUF2975 domain-containing protein n=1 Tax=Clostridium chromiireducens TaxID=225345 RepID=A0A964W5E9_9CLOT|nr:DUF2975 domain-containing protein [Clostridium chromiireducens]MVX67208.1 DUF2975 domain-containing protein [Clostridium chromiireducens]